MKDQSTAPPPARRAAVYLRTGPLAEMLESDLEPLQAYAAERGYQIVDVYRDEGKSGRDRKRAGLARLRGVPGGAEDAGARHLNSTSS